MARRSRYNEKIADKIVEYISLGFTLRDTSYAVGVSDETIRRWRERHLDFNKRVIEASNQQWERPETLIKYRHPNYRAYRRPKIALSPDYDKNIVKHSSDTEKPLLEPLKPAKPQTVCGLPIRLESASTEQKTPPYYNATTKRVEWVDVWPPTGELTRRHCSLYIYEKKLEEERQRMAEPFIFCVV